MMVREQDDGDLNQDHCNAGRGIWEVELVGLNGWLAVGRRVREGSLLRNGGPFKRLHSLLCQSRDGEEEGKRRFQMKMMKFRDLSFN